MSDTKIDGETKSHAAESGIFVIPSEKQAAIKAFVGRSEELIKQMGNLEFQYHGEKNRIFQAFGMNEQSRNAALNRIATEAGMDLSKEEWSFDLSTMSFTRIGKKTPVNMESQPASA